MVNTAHRKVNAHSAKKHCLKCGNNTNDLVLLDGAKVSCTSGAYASHIVGKVSSTHGVEKLPDGMGMDVASMFVMPAVGLFGVDMANPRMGDTVVVFGTGLIGLGVVAACAHRGCVVIAVDLDANRLAVAKSLGADYLIDASIEDVNAAVRQIVPDGADAVFESTGIPACIDLAIPLCRSFGSFVWQGNYGADPVFFHFLPAHGRRLQKFFPCDDGLQPCRRAVLKNLEMGRWIGIRQSPTGLIIQMHPRCMTASTRAKIRISLAS